MVETVEFYINRFNTKLRPYRNEYQTYIEIKHRIQKVETHRLLHLNEQNWSVLPV